VEFGSTRGGWYVGQAYYPLLVGLIFTMNTINFLQTYPPVIAPQIQKEGEIDVWTKISLFSIKLAKISFVLALIVFLVTFGPSIFYTIKGSQKLNEVIGRKVTNTVPTPTTPVVEAYQPPFDPTLPKEAHVTISAIGVDSQIFEGSYDNYEEILKKGIWRVADFGTPFTRDTPTILAAHRFGYLAWTNIFRRKNSFFNLPKLKEGDTVEIVWRQRKYVYEIYKTSKGEQIEDYSADLILYTCEDMGSEVRIFKYARLLKI